MSREDGWPSGCRALFEKLCWLCLGSLPEDVHIAISDAFDPGAFGWEGIRPDSAIEVARAYERAARAVEGVPAAEDAASGTAATAEDAPVGEGAPAPLRRLTLASREFWLMEASFVANAVCSFSVASFLAWHMDFFQGLMLPLGSRLLEVGMNATVWLVTAVGVFAAWRMWERPSYYALPRVLGISLACFLPAELLVVDAIAYTQYFFGW